MIENPKNANISNKVKTNSGSIVLPFCFMPPPVVLVCSQFGLNLGTKVCQSSPMQRSGFQFSCFCLDGGQLLVLGLILVRSGRGSDAGELVPEAGRQDALHLLHDEVQRSKQRAEKLQRDKEKTNETTRLTDEPTSSLCVTGY